MAKEKWFKLINEEFSKLDNEWQWTYECLSEFTLNQKKIIKITVTDHYQLEHKDVMTNEKILEILLRLNGEIIKSEPKKKPTWDDWIWVRDGYPD